MSWLKSLGDSIERGFEQIGNELEEFGQDVAKGVQRAAASVNYVEPFERVVQGARDLYVGAEKWITGPSDQPDPRTEVNPAYRRVEGQLFVRGPGDVSDIDWSDIDQGSLGDCYLLASLAAVAKANPDALRRMVRDNGDGTYTVTLNARRLPWEPGKGDFKQVEVTVTAEFPFLGGAHAYAKPTDGGPSSPELWVLVIEKAYASYYGRYAHIENGFPGHAMELITGAPSRSFPPHMLSLQELSRYQQAGYALTVATAPDLELGPFDLPDVTDRDPLYTSKKLIANHAYFIESVDLERGTVTIRNPWGPTNPPIVLTEDQLHRLFADVSLNPTR